MGTRVSSLGPSERSNLILFKQGELLLNTEPRLVLLGSLHNLGGSSTTIGGERFECRGVGLAKNKDVVTTSEGVGVDGYRLEEDLTVI